MLDRGAVFHTFLSRRFIDDIQSDLHGGGLVFVFYKQTKVMKNHACKRNVVFVVLWYMALGDLHFQSAALQGGRRIYYEYLQ